MLLFWFLQEEIHNATKAAWKTRNAVNYRVKLSHSRLKASYSPVICKNCS